jgi:hypothetical protein
MCYPQRKHTTKLEPRFFLYTGHFIMFSVITNIYNKKTKGSTLMELFTDTGKRKVFFLTTRHVAFKARIIAAVKNIDASM